MLRAASTDMLCAPMPSTWNQNFPSYTPILTACLVSVSMPSERRSSLIRLVCSMHSSWVSGSGNSSPAKA